MGMTMRKSTLNKVLFAADIYNDENVWAPNKIIAENLNVTRRTAERLIVSARELGLITRETIPHGPPKNPLIHGTLHGYQKHKCRCKSCRDAHAKIMDHYAQSRRSRKDSAQFQHGRNGYNNWGCRCDICCADHQAMLRANYEKRKARSSQAPHGTPAGYAGWGCRCELCNAAGKEYRDKYRRRKADA
jgi:hypothetical protein